MSRVVAKAVDDDRLVETSSRDFLVTERALVYLNLMQLN